MALAITVSVSVMKPLLTKLSMLMGNEYKNIKGLRKKVVALNDELSAMNAFLEEMEDADELSPQDKYWRNLVREMAYDVEDCIDDFMCRVNNGAVNVEDGILQKAAHHLRKFMARHQIANQVQKLNTRVREEAERRRRYKLGLCVPNSSTSLALDHRLIALHKDSANLVGIDGPKKELIKWIMDEKQQLKVLSIVGFGGVGKTTLANHVYHQIGGDFGCKAFVSVSQRYDVLGLLNSISSQLTRHDSCSHDVDNLINSLKTYLLCKRYFIVIDDLWDSHAWRVLSCVFPENNLGSRVVVTTRSRSVGVACCCPNECIFDMKPLSHEDSRRLFVTRIFGSEDGCPSNYEEVSDDILKRCGGLPLAVTTIASLLAVQKMRPKEEWEYIRNSLSAQVGANPTLQGMKEILNLSYTHLPHHLRACFLYIGMYPEDYVIHRDDLVKQWVAEGFVSNLHGLDAVDVADNYFIELANRSLIQPASIGLNDRVLTFRVHDMVHHMIRSKCAEDNFISLDDSPQPGTELYQYKVRRFSIVSNDDEDGIVMPLGMTSVSQVRSVAVLRSLRHICISRGTIQVHPLSKFKFLRMLLLQLLPPDETTRMRVTDLTGISQLLHLRYLSVFSKRHVNNSLRLPNQIRSLRQLETLETHGITVESIPTDIVHLPRLSHLSLSFCARVPLPDGVASMKSLRTMEYFDLVHSSLENINGLGELTNLRQLALSHDNEDGETVPAEKMYALFSSIQKLGKLKCLNLTNFSGNNDRAVSSLSPRRHIFLHLPGCTLPLVPRWTRDLCHLCSLSIAVDTLCKADLHLIGELPSLTDLNLSMAAPTEKIIISQSAGFSHVNQFGFACPMLSYLIFETGGMPSLQTLYLEFPVARWDGIRPPGLEQLSSLQEIIVQVSENIPVNKHEGTALEIAFRNAKQAHPNRPIITQSYFVAINLRELTQSPDTEQSDVQCFLTGLPSRRGKNLILKSSGPSSFGSFT